MAQECGFFNAELEGSEYDRVYNAEQFAAYFASFISNGVFGNSMGELVVLENQQANMSVDVSSGQGWINGWWYRNTEELNLPIALADGILNRKDIVVLRWGNAERGMWLQVIQGEPSGEPIAPSIVRNADYYDLKLCEISIPAGTSRITQSLITDTRLDNNVCGLVTGVVDQIDTTQLFIQFQAAYADWKNIQEADFESWTAEQQQDYNTWITTNQNAFITWFNHMKDQLDSDAAGHLQNEIDDLQVYVDEGLDNIELKRFVGENFAEIGTKEGSALAHTIYGMSVQDGTPTPDSPVEIQSAKADFKCVGKNLIPYPYRQERISSNPILINGVTWTVNADKTMSAVGTASGNNSNYYLTDWRDGYPLFRGGETYTLSGCPSGGNTTTYCLIFYGFLPNQSGSELTPAFHKFDTGNGVTFTIPQDCYGRIYCRVINETTAPTNAFKPMLTLVGANHTYEPYQHTDVTTDLTLRAIEVASTDDYTYERDGKYYIADTVDWSEDEGYKITRRVERYNVTSLGVSTTPIYSSINNANWDYTKYVLPSTNTIAPLTYSNYFIKTNYAGITGSDGNGKIYFNSNIHLLMIRVDGMTSQADWNTWLSNHSDMYVDLILATPTTEPITSQQAQALLSLKTYDEATSISATGDIEPSVNLEYSKTNIGAKALTGHNEAASKGGTPGVFYNTDADAEADIANIPEGSMVYTNESISRKENGSLVKKADKTRGNLTAEDDLQFQFSKSGSNYGYKDANGNFVPFKKVQASKAVTASTSAQTVTPDSGYHGIASVTVNPTPSQSKSVTATTSAQTVSPDSGKLLSSVTVNPQVHSETRASVTSNGTIDLGTNHATRYVPVNVPQYSKPFEVITIGMRQLNQEDTCYLTRYNNGLAGGGTLVGSQNGRGGSYTLQGNYASYYYNEGVSEDVNYNTVTITLKVNAYIDGVYSSAGGTYSFTIGSGYSMPSHIVTPA